jgi:hypothetical protein
MLSGVKAFLLVQSRSLSEVDCGAGANEIVTLAIVACVVEEERSGRWISDILSSGVFVWVFYACLSLNFDFCCAEMYSSRFSN